MALTELSPSPKWRLSQGKALVCSLLGFLCLHMASGTSGWGGCLDSQEIFATVRENSRPGEIISEVTTDAAVDGVRWSLDGEDADWFFFDGRNLRLNTSSERILDREAQDPVLIAELRCFEEDILQSVFRIMVEIQNENDNSPVFAENTIQPVFISELTPVNTVIFTVQATDADYDKIIYSIDHTSPDAEYFKIELPNSGEVVLSKPLDYETKTLLNVTINAAEMTTAEHFNTSTTIIITVLDGDDQYPQFLPCILLLQDETNRICTSPLYTVNITEGQSDIVLDFSPGPIHAVDGDRGLSSPVSYAIISGNDDGCLLMDKETGEVRLIQGVKDRLATPTLHLQVMAYQNDDRRKYAVATVLVRVLAQNQFHPEFEVAEYHGFVTAGRSPTSLVNTYGSKALMLHVVDRDFMHGFNPMIHFTLSPTSNHTDIYHVTQEGLVIARANQVQPKQKHILKVTAVDQESGDAAIATIVVEVLPEGQAIPLSSQGDDRLTGCVVGKALALCVFFMCVLGCFLSTLSWLLRRHKEHRGPLERGCVAQGKHPNVSLQWFQQVSYRSAMPQMEEVQSNNKEYGICNPSFSPPDKPGTHQDLPPCRETCPPMATTDTSCTLAKPVCNASTLAKSSSGLPTIHRATLDVDASPTTQQCAPPKGKLGSPTAQPKTDQDSTEARQGFTVPDASDVSSTILPSFTCPDSHATCSRTRVTLSQTDKPHCKPHVNTPPKPSYSTEETTMANLVHMESSLHTTPPVTPQQTSVTSYAETCCQVDLPSTSLDDTHQSGHLGGLEDSGAAPQKRGLSTQEDAVNIQDGCWEGDEDENELEADEEELLRVLARLNPTFISFSK